ncbi:aldo/keto reductase [Moritella sp. 24]|uniref:aldo/keto reductase n=1 Tax=Moritella sp. 24 TaxID=2746230 RepID=UPI001BAA7D90|nr:aldo/keto reductase [Moritella sp. 24]QUM77327.1 aldo/keto reductase [Moritella sp. 24]
MTKVSRTKIAPEGPVFSSLVQGYWRMGDWNMDPQSRLTFLKQHVELGITTVDHAHVYGSAQAPCETLFGEALKLDPAMRDEIEIISKCGIEVMRGDAPSNHVNHYNSSQSNIIRSVETSLQRLGVEQLDVLLIHRPDILMDADEVASAAALLKRQGKIKHLGVSNFTPSQFALLQSRCDAPLVTNQVEINPLNLSVTEDGTLDQLQQFSVRPMAWSCLAGGALFDTNTDNVQRLQQTLNAIKQEIGAKSIEQVVFSWVLRLPSQPLPIIGSGNIERVRSAVAATELTLSNQQWYRIWVASKGHGVA